MQNDLSIFELYALLLKNKKTILFSTIGACIISVVATLMMENKFLSTSKFYPISSNTLNVKNVLLDQETYFFGSEDDIDRVITLGQSAELKNFIIEKYDLVKVYEIDTQKSEYPLLVAKAFDSHYEIKRSDLGYVVINVYDVDAHRASNMANDIRIKIDELNLKLLNENNFQLLQYYQNELEAKTNYIETLKFTIDSLKSKYNIKASSSTTMIGKQKIRMTNGSQQYQKGSTQVDALEVELLDQVSLLTRAKNKSSEIKLFIENLKTSISTIESAKPAFKKAKPVRSMIVAISTMLAFFVVALWIIVHHIFQKHRVEL
jgi:hypothetical protein